MTSAMIFSEADMFVRSPQTKTWIDGPVIHHRETIIAGGGKNGNICTLSTT